MKFLSLRILTRWNPGLTGLFYASLACAQTPIKAPVNAVQISGACTSCDMSNRVMPRISLQQSNFAGSDFSQSNLSGAKLHNANLEGASFHKTYLMKVEGENVNLKRAILRDATLTGATIRKSDMSFTDLRRADLSGSRFTETSFRGAFLKGADAMQADFSNTDFSGAHFDHGNFTEANFYQAVLINVDFGDAMITDCTFSGANLSGAKLAKAVGIMPDQFETACGDQATMLPQGFEITTCPPKKPYLSVKQMVAAEKLKPGDGRNRLRKPAPQGRSIPVSVRRTYHQDLDDALKELDAAMHDLPPGNPMRSRLEEARQHVENAKDR